MTLRALLGAKERKRGNRIAAERGKDENGLTVVEGSRQNRIKYIKIPNLVGIRSVDKGLLVTFLLLLASGLLVLYAASFYNAQDSGSPRAEVYSQPVSYTHLDVYKRQVHGHLLRPVCGAGRAAVLLAMHLSLIHISREAGRFSEREMVRFRRCF